MPRLLLFVALTALASGPAEAQPIKGSQAPESSTGAEAAVGNGFCAVCGHRVDRSHSHLVKGRRVFLCPGPCEQAWAEDPDAAFLNLQARGAFLDEQATGLGGLFSGWLFAGLYLVAGLICGGISAYLAVQKLLSPWPWFFAGLLLNVAAVLAIAFCPARDRSGLPDGVAPGLRKVASTAAPVACPACGALQHPSARECAACGGTLSPRFESEVGRVRRG